MGRVLVTAALAAVVAFALGLAGAEAEVTRTPTLRMLDSSPLTVRGTAFKPRERVRVTAVADVRRVRALRVSRAGTFTTRFADLALDPCSGGGRVLAVGARGSSAELKVVPRMCPPPLRP